VCIRSYKANIKESFFHFFFFFEQLEEGKRNKLSKQSPKLNSRSAREKEFFFQISLLNQIILESLEGHHFSPKKNNVELITIMCSGEKRKGEIRCNNAILEVKSCFDLKYYKKAKFKL